MIEEQSLTDLAKPPVDQALEELDIKPSKPYFTYFDVTQVAHRAVEIALAIERGEIEVTETNLDGGDS